MDKYGKCTAEYSFSQNKFHCDYLNETLTRNKRRVIDNIPSDWIIIGIFDTWEETQEFIEKFKQQL